MKISYKHYNENDEIEIVLDISKGNQHYQIYYKTKAVNKITDYSSLFCILLLKVML